MKVIEINKQDLIKSIAVNCTLFGDPFMGLYVDSDGNIDCVEQSESGDSMPVLTFAGMGGFQDDNGLHTDDEQYDATGVAEYIVESGDCLKFNGTLLNDSGEDVEYKFTLIE